MFFRDGKAVGMKVLQSFFVKDAPDGIADSAHQANLTRFFWEGVTYLVQGGPHQLQVSIGLQLHL